MRVQKLFAVALAAAFVSLVPEHGAAETRQPVRLATGGQGGVYLPLGNAMAAAWMKEVDGLTVTPEASFASVTNVLLVRSGVADMAFVQNDIASYGYRGEEMFANQLLAQNSRGIAMLYPEPVQIVTLAGSGIGEVEDLAGRRVALARSVAGPRRTRAKSLKSTVSATTTSPPITSPLPMPAPRCGTGSSTRRS